MSKNRFVEKVKKVKNKEQKKIKRGANRNNDVVDNPIDIVGHRNKIMCGKSEELMLDFPDNFIDIIITSPPYNFGLDYKDNENEDTLSWEEYFKWLGSIWAQCYRCLKPGGRICVNLQPLFSDYVPTHHLVSKQLLDLGFLWKGEILWEKNHYNCKYTAWGSWKSPSMPYLKYTWEFVELLCKETYKKTGDKDKIDIEADEFKKWVYAKWDIAPEKNMGKYGHPAMFPEDLVMRLLKLFSYEGDLVFDPFNGAGTTTFVARKFRRDYLGIDVSEEYCEIARNRMDDLGILK